MICCSIVIHVQAGAVLSLSKFVKIYSLKSRQLNQDQSTLNLRLKGSIRYLQFNQARLRAGNSIRIDFRCFMEQHWLQWVSFRRLETEVKARGLSAAVDLGGSLVVASKGFYATGVSTDLHG